MQISKFNQTLQQLDCRSSLKRSKCSDDELKALLPENFHIGQAIGGGDCFFDSVAKGLKQLKPAMDFTVESLREVCKRFAQNQLNDESWLKEALKNEAEPINKYVQRIEFTAGDITQRPEPALLELSGPIWGRTEIEGRMICKEYNVKLHVIEKHNVERKEIWTNQIVDKSGSKSAEEIDYSENKVIHVVNKGDLHFEPVLRKQEIQQRLSDYDDNKGNLNECFSKQCFAIRKVRKN